MGHSSRSIIATKCIAAGLALGLGISPAFAKPKISVVNKTYAVSGKTAKELTDEMRRKGPNGFWAYTRWDIRWTGSCRVTVKVTYTLPKHRKPSVMPSNIRKSWERMRAALVAHEKLHGAHGVSAAQEIAAAGCKNGNAIIRKYNKADQALDRRTNHGKTQGVVLK